MDGKKRTKSIRVTLIVIMALLVAVPVVLLTIVSAANTVTQGKDAANEVNRAQAAIVHESLENIFEKNIEAIKVIASSPLTISFLEGSVSDDSVADAILGQMLKIDESMADGNSTALSDATGQQLLCTVGKTVNVAEREYFKEPMAGAEYYISDMIVSKSTGTAIATFSVPVYNSDKSKVIGIVQRNYDVTDLHDLIAGEVTQDRQEIVVVDRTGTVVAHSARGVNTEDPEKQDQNPFYTDSRGDKTNGDYVAPFMGDTWVISWEKIPSSEWVVASCRVQEVALATVYRTVIMQTILGMLFLIASIVVAFFMAKSITDPLLDVDKTMEALAGGEFRHIDRFTERADEFGGIIRNTNNVTDKLKHIVGNIISNAGTVSKESDELADTSEQISRNADDVSNAVQEIATGATQQANEIESVTENMGRIEEAVASVQRSTGDLAGIAARMQAASSESSKSLSELQNSSAAMNSAINGISDKISATSDAVERINGMVEAITSIASQTNLLALNASIEAARAGDAGRGFAVVAEEIGKLASDSSNSADQIRSEMDELLSESQAAVSMADDVQKTNMEQQKVISSTSDSVNMMISDIEETVRSVKQIEANAEACVSAKDVVVDAMSSLSAISEENAASTEETGAAMEELSATVTTLASSAGALNRISAELSEEMSFFKM